MCPACFATMALAAAGGASAGGLTALARRKLRTRTGAKIRKATIPIRRETR